MKKIFITLFAGIPFIFTGCKKIIDVYPQSNLSTATYFSNTTEMYAALNGCYNGLQNPLNTEWMMTDLRTDVSKQGVPASTSAANIELNDLDMYTVNAPHQQVYNYWLATYNNIRNTNVVLQKLGVVYDEASSSIRFDPINIPVTQAERNQIAGEAMILRAYHYFNLVRLFGGVFLVHAPLAPDAAKKMNRAPLDDIYKLIIADLRTASDTMRRTAFNSITATDRGRVNVWTARAMLAKVYLTLNRKSEATTLLNDVIANSGYGLQANYDNVFSTANEVNNELLFVIRYKSGGLGLGSPFGNLFAPLGSGAAVINGDGSGLNFPTQEINDAFVTADRRKAISVASFGSGAALRLYTRKYLTPVTVARDGESDWPVLRYADVLLMLAEAQGFTTASVNLINQIRTRAGLPNITASNVAQFEVALANERRLEFAFENHRFFDLVRYGTTLTTINPIDAIRAHFANEYTIHYAQYAPPVPTLAQLQANVTAQKLLLPIPQREIDTNTNLKITQNPGY